jgi:co-chaperonin GroES (HSP10)
LNEAKRASPSEQHGAVVVNGHYSATDVHVEGKEFKILRESEILAKFA